MPLAPGPRGVTASSCGTRHSWPWRRWRFFSYGGLIAVQSLWAGPWLTQVAGWSADQAAQGLFFINLCMLFAFLAWGALMPRLVKAGISASG